jgi:hypothetical protein
VTHTAAQGWNRRSGTVKVEKTRASASGAHRGPTQSLPGDGDVAEGPGHGGGLPVVLWTLVKKKTVHSLLHAARVRRAGLGGT